MFSGTQLAMEFANEGLRAVNNRRHLRHFHSLDTFSGGSSTRLRFMRHFLSDGMDDAQYEKILRYISGRHRILTVFLTWRLIVGVRHSDDILGTLLHKATGLDGQR